LVAFFNSNYFHLKHFNKHNFFKHTFCEFDLINDFEFPENTNYKSSSNSLYFYTEEGVYRKSNHWGRVANCRWKLNSEKTLKNQFYYVGFAKWSDFFSINETEKVFYISIDYKNKTVKLQPKKENTINFLFTFSEAQKRIKKIKHLLTDEKWASYFDNSLDEIRMKIISEYINSEKSLKRIKMNLK